MFTLNALKKAGIEETDVRFENIPAMDVLTALKEGRIDAGHTWESVTSQALKMGYKILGKAGDIPGIITDVLAFNKEVIQKRPDDIERIVKSLLEAKDFIYSNRDEALGIMSKAEGMSREEVERGIKGVHHLDLKENVKAMTRSKEMTSLYGSGEMVADFYINRGQLSQMLDLDEMVEPGFVKNIAKGFR
jgi:NitT/TauT family transport system substrate-binding protein